MGRSAPTLYYLITNAQLLALEQRRNGDLRLELQVNGVLPQAASGFPGAAQVTEYISIAESRWRQQLAGLGRTLGAEMVIPFPDDDEPRPHWLSHRTLPHSTCLTDRVRAYHRGMSAPGERMWPAH